MEGLQARRKRALIEEYLSMGSGPYFGGQWFHHRNSFFVECLSRKKQGRIFPCRNLFSGNYGKYKRCFPRNNEY